MTGLRIRVYECIKGVTKVSGLQKEDLANGSKIGVLPAAVSLLLAEDRIEFSVVLEGKRPQKNGPPEILWLGYHFFGQFSNLQRCFRKKYRDAETIFSILHKNLTTKFTDPFTSPMLLIDNSAKGFWQISSTEAPHEVLGFIPLHRTDMFHSLKSYPIIFFEGEKAQAIVGSDLDRNNLYHANAELDAAYTQTLRKLSGLFKSQKWCSVVLPENTGSENSTATNTENGFPDINAGQKFDLRSLSHWLARDDGPLTLVYGLSLWRKGVARDFDLATLGASASGRSHLVNFLHTFSLSPHYKEGGDNVDLDLTTCKTLLDSLFEDLKEMKSIVSHGTAIYNPFFEKSRVAERGNLPNPSLVIESQSLKLHNTPPKPSSYKFPKQLTTPVLSDPPSTSTADTSFLNEDQSPKKQPQSQQPQSTSPLPKPFPSLSSDAPSSPRTNSPRALSSSPSPLSTSANLSSSPSPMSPDHQQQLMVLLQQRKNSLRQQQNNTPPPPSSSPSPIPLSTSPVPLSSPSPLHRPSPLHPQPPLPSSPLPPKNEEASQFLMDFIKKEANNNTNNNIPGLLTPSRLQSTTKPQQGWSDPGIVQSGNPRDVSSDIDMGRLAQALVNVLKNPNYNFRLIQ